MRRGMRRPLSAEADLREERKMKLKSVSLAVLLLLALLLPACALKPNETEVNLMSSTIPASQERESLPAVPTIYGCDALFFGDSITADGNFDALFPGLLTVNLGVYGDTLEDLRRRVPEVRGNHPARIFLLGGINCLTEDRFDRCVAEYAELMDALLAACPDSELLVQSVLPVSMELTDPAILTNDTIRRFNAEIKSLAVQRGCPYVDLWPSYEKNGGLDPALTRDGLHLNYTAYGPWADRIAPYLPDPEHRN